MTNQLPERADLEHLKGQAKALLEAVKSSDSEALARIGEPENAVRLADAQRIIAREYGFSSWGKLKQFVEGFPDRKAAFFRAVRAGDRNLVGQLLDFDPGLVHAHDDASFGASVITVASGRDDRPLIDLLLERGANIDGRSTWWAGSFGALDMASEETSHYLLSKGAKLTVHAAARLGFAGELKAMINRNPDAVFERGGDGQFPLHFSKSPEIVDILIDAGALPDARDLDHVSTAAQFRIKEADVCRRLIDRGATPDIYIAILLEDVALLERLVKDDPECLSRTPMHPGNPMIPEAPGMPIYTYTIGIGRPFQIALAHGKQAAARVIEDHSTPVQKLLSACWRNDEVGAKRLADHVGELTEADSALLADAAWDRKRESVKLMLELGFNPDSVGIHHSSPLDRAAFHGFDDVIELVLRFGPSLTIQNEFGGTPLSACVHGSLNSWRKDGNFPRSVELLLEAGSPRRDKMRGSPEVNVVLEKYGIKIG